jgi:hypothetical protein
MWYGCNKTVPVSTTASPLSFPWEGLLFAGSPNAAGFRVVAQLGKSPNGVILNASVLKDLARTDALP